MEIYLNKLKLMRGSHVINLLSERCSTLEYFFDLLNTFDSEEVNFNNLSENTLLKWKTMRSLYR
jgi:hypothetical protein